MAQLLELLSQTVKIKHRSSDQLVQTGGRMHYDEATHALQIELIRSKEAREENSSSDRSHRAIPLNRIKLVKAMDYIEGTRVVCVLVLHLRPKDAEEISEFYAPEEQIILQFARVEDRDTWDTGLRHLQAAFEMAAVQDNVEVPTRGYSRIKKVKLEEPRAGFVVAARFELANGQEELFEVNETLITGQDKKKKKKLNELVVDWVKKNCVLPSETTSLYRLVNSLVHRATLEMKTADVIRRINECHFTYLQAEDDDRSGMEILEHAKAELSELERDMPNIVGQHGTAAFMMIQILRRNIEKMKAINELAFKVHESKLQEL